MVTSKLESKPATRRISIRGALFAAVCLMAGAAAGCQPETASSDDAVVLGTAGSFAVLGGSTVTSTGPTTVFGDLGLSPGTAVIGFPPGLVIGGVIHVADAVAMQAQADVTTAYVALAGQACDHDLTGQDLGGLTLVPGVYCFSASAGLTGALTLDAAGDPDAVFVFQIGTSLVTASGASVRGINGASGCNAFWQVGSSATLGTATAFIGNIVALSSITLTTGARLQGRAHARNGAVTLDTNHVEASDCSSDAPPTIDAGTSIDAGPQCPGTMCGETCADFETDNANCGSCGNECHGDTACMGGSCACAGTMCGTMCVELADDLLHCGACNNPCAAEEACSAGVCVSTQT